MMASRWVAVIRGGKRPLVVLFRSNWAEGCCAKAGVKMPRMQRKKNKTNEGASDFMVIGWFFDVEV